ncbi:MAG: hypothetical protein HYX69_12905 [Planctomycetia bacterium]|nr:hypothetical protein [Planctomycetia bacterium]
MSISFRCPNGHLLKVKDKYAGQTGLCPHCQARVLVPRLPENEKMSEEAIADFIGPPPVDDEEMPVHQEPTIRDPMGGSGSSLIQAAMSARETKTCPKCKQEVRLCYALCPYCHTYFSDLSEITRRISQEHK